MMNENELNRCQFASICQYLPVACLCATATVPLHVKPLYLNVDLKIMNSNQVVDVCAGIFFTLRDLEDADEVAMFNYSRARMSDSRTNEQFARLGFPRVRLRRAPC